MPICLDRLPDLVRRGQRPFNLGPPVILWRGGGEEEAEFPTSRSGRNLNGCRGTRVPDGVKSSLSVGSHRASCRGYGTEAKATLHPASLSSHLCSTVRSARHDLIVKGESPRDAERAR